MSKPEEIIYIGNSLTTDILFGNLNNITTIWCHKHFDKFQAPGIFDDLLGICKKDNIDIENT